MGALIRVENVSRRYGEVEAVKRLSFEVAGGEIVGLLGPNGAGKTTALRMMATLLKPDEGRIVINGHDTLEEPRAVRAELGYQTGDTGLYGRLTPVEFLRYFARLNETPRERIEERIGQLVAEFDMDEFVGRRCSELSTGQKQRVSIARALLNDPPVVILDEPTVGLDIVSSAFVLDSLRRGRDAGRGILFSTHILSEVELVCDRVVIMHKGEHRFSGSLEEMRSTTGMQSLSKAFLCLIGELAAS
ncbi:MAG: hypothetical protein CO108_03780 [Deltaproteobacteria bacterium CG_4_9_14_3_um_filter_63_12]|nr:MAG: hypothetical protein CO108_03780 [Deltaproteobacteria bacterium CG_4_9_14_3_um_filter_63_12]